MSEKSSVRKEIALVAGPREWGENNKSMFARVARKVPTVTFRTVKALWYGEIQDDDHWAARDIRRAAEDIKRCNEASALASQYETLADSLNAKDADFYSQDVHSLIHAARLLREMDRA